MTMPVIIQKVEKGVLNEAGIKREQLAENPERLSWHDLDLRKT